MEHGIQLAKKEKEKEKYMVNKLLNIYIKLQIIQELC